MDLPAGSPADRAMRGLPSGRSALKRSGCKCAACGHCRRDHEKKNGPCLECKCRGFL